MSFGRDEIAALIARPREVVKVPVPGGEVCIRVLKGPELAAYHWATNRACKDLPEDAAVPHYNGRLAAVCLCDAYGKALYSLDAAAELDELPAPILAVIVQAAEEANGLTLAARKELRKNWSGAPMGASDSTSLPGSE